MLKGNSRDAHQDLLIEHHQLTGIVQLFVLSICTSWEIVTKETPNSLNLNDLDNSRIPYFLAYNNTVPGFDDASSFPMIQGNLQLDANPHGGSV